MSGPFKMKGSPLQRNFGISPLKHPHPEHPHKKKSKKRGPAPETHPDYFKGKNRFDTNL